MKKLNIRFISILVIIWVLDFASKIWAESALANNHVINIINDFFRFHLVYNTGGVFGIFQGNTLVFHILTGVAIIFLLVYYFKNPEENKLYNFAINFILGGALGNFTDRFFRHGVVDFIDMGVNSHFWPTYNIADAFISVGAVLLAIAFIQIEKREKKLRQADKTSATANRP